MSHQHKQDCRCRVCRNHRQELELARVISAELIQARRERDRREAGEWDAAGELQEELERGG